MSSSYSRLFLKLLGLCQRILKQYFLLACFLCAVCGCVKQETADSRWRQANGKVKILTTIAMINDLVKQIGGEDVDTIPLICGELDPHSYELVKGDDEKFARADLIFYNGLGLEHGLSIRQNLENNPKAIAITRKLVQENPELILTIDGQYDPHIWMDIALWIRMIDPIVDTLAQKDPVHASLYRERANVLRQKMHEADEQAYAVLQAINPEKRYLVTSHDAFHYFTRHYLAMPGEHDWQCRCKAPEGLAPEAQMSVSDVMAIISYIEARNIFVLFPESNISKDALRKIVDAGKEKGFDIRLCQESLYGDSMGDAKSYLDMMSHNINIIARELDHE